MQRRFPLGSANPSRLRCKCPLPKLGRCARTCPWLCLEKKAFPWCSLSL